MGPQVVQGPPATPKCILEEQLKSFSPDSPRSFLHWQPLHLYSSASPNWA